MCACLCVCVCVCVCAHAHMPSIPRGKEQRPAPDGCPSGYNILLLSLTPHNLHTYTSGFYSRKLKPIVLDSVWLSFSLDRSTGMSWKQLMHFTNQCIDLGGTRNWPRVFCALLVPLLISWSQLLWSRFSQITLLKYVNCQIMLSLLHPSILPMSLRDKPKVINFSNVW